MSHAEMEDADRDALRRLFFEEAEEGLLAVEEALIALERGQAQDEGLRVLFRGAHTLKGNAASLGFDELAEVTHHLEDVLERLRAGALEVNRAVVDVLLASVDLLRSLLAGGQGMTADKRELLERLRALGTGIGRPRRAAVAARGRSRRRGGAVGDQGPPGADPEGQRRDPRPHPRPHGRDRRGSGPAARSPGGRNGGGGRTDAAEIHREADRLHADLQELVMKARMEPLGPILRRFSRTVRDLSAALGKSARLVLEGEDVEVDTKVVELVRDPLTHLVRNALGHGLERPAERVARGKDALRHHPPSRVP